MDSVRQEVEGKVATKDEAEIVHLQEPDEEVQEVEKVEVEAAITILLNELDYWDDGNEEEEDMAGKV